MKIWLDDEFENRKSWFPADWIHCRWPEDVIAYLKTGKVSELSLDHDLEDTTYLAEGRKEKTGYEVLLWIENQVITNGFIPPILHVHSQNASAKQKMNLAISEIYNRSR